MRAQAPRGAPLAARLWARSRPLLLAACAVLGLGADPAAPAPRCGPDEALTIRRGALRCVSLRRPSPAPDCVGLLQSRDPATGGELGSWRCLPPPPTDWVEERAAVAALQERARAVAAAVEGLARDDGPALFVGVSRATTTGRMEHAGAATGLLAAAAICGDDYPGAHMCTPFELYDSVVAGALTSVTSIARAWIYAPAWKLPLGDADSPLLGLADNCAGYSYDKDDRGWAGAAVRWGVLPTTRVGFYLYGGSEARCSARLPVACCRAGGAP